MTRRIAVLLGCTVAVALAAVGPAFSQSGVTVQLFQFRPDQLEVKAGSRVTWTNQDDIEHTVTSGEPGTPDKRFEVKLSGKGARGQVELREPGVYAYFCSRHPSMRGEIRVK